MISKKSSKRPKIKLSRQLNLALTPKATKYMQKKPYPPGDQRVKPRYKGRITNYKNQLLEKQRLKAQYNVSERQMLNYYKKAVRKKGSTTDNIIQMLETRLDAVVFRGGLAYTIYAARQDVSHGHIQINGKRVDIASCQVKVNDVVSVKRKERSIFRFIEAAESANPPEYLSLSNDDLSVKLLHIPNRDEVPVICEMSLVIEFYSH